MSKADPDELAAVERERQQGLACRVFCCASTGCNSSGCPAVMEAIARALDSHGIADVVEIVPTGCMGLCSLGPLVRVEVAGREPVLYQEADPLKARLIVAEHIARALEQGDSFERPGFLNEYTLSLDLPFFTRQERVVLANNGEIDPEKIEQYLARGGYRAARRALTEMSPEQVIDEILKSGLRGRGGAGYPTGWKWRHTREAEGDEKFMICNGDEGDPGAYMDRSILEGDPHAVLEGMVIAARAVGASKGWFYIRAEYPLAVERVNKAIRASRKSGLLGKGLFGSDFDFDAEVRLGAGAFVCGEETALIHSIEGERGAPRPRPPYPSASGLWGKPTCINNVETLANVPAIIERGADWFSSMGTENTKGTKVFALTGTVRYSGLIEVPAGMPLREIVEDIGGGAPDGHSVKAIQTGGPSGGVIPADELDNPVCFEILREMGSIMGSGGMIVLDEDDDMVDIAAFYLGFTVEESCGKCAPCRVGGVQMLRLLEKIRDGEGTTDDIDTIRRLALAMEKASLCGLGQTAANPVTSSLKYFANEYYDKVRPAEEPVREWRPRVGGLPPSGAEHEPA